MISSECNTQWFMLFFFRVLNRRNSFSRYRVSLASVRKKKSEDRRFARFSDFAGLVLQRCSPAKLTVPLPMEVLGNA